MSLDGDILTTDTATTGLRHGDSAVLHIRIDDGDGLLTEPCYTSSTTEADAPSAEVLPEQNDPALATASNYNSFDEWAQPKCLCWIN